MHGSWVGGLGGEGWTGGIEGEFFFLRSGSLPCTKPTCYSKIFTDAIIYYFLCVPSRYATTAACFTSAISDYPPGPRTCIGSIRRLRLRGSFSFDWCVIFMGGKAGWNLALAFFRLYGAGPGMLVVRMALLWDSDGATCFDFQRWKPIRAEISVPPDLPQFYKSFDEACGLFVMLLSP